MFLFTSRPPSFQSDIEVAGCYCESEGRFLFLQRHRNKPIGLKWGIPAGKLEPGESPLEGVIRETQEETGISLNPSSLFYAGKGFIQIPEGEFIFHFFYMKFEKIPKVVINQEHEDFCWATRKEASKLPLIRGAEECFDFVLSSLPEKWRERETPSLK